MTTALIEDQLTQRVTVKSFDQPYPTCLEPTDEFQLPTINVSLPLSFAYCRPLKYSLSTLDASGSTLGLAPSSHLSQTRATPVLTQLLEKEAIQRPIFSLMLINGEDGVLSLGGTAASAIDMVEAETKAQLDLIGGHEEQKPAAPVEKMPPLVKRGRTSKGIVMRQPDWDDSWTWSDVQGAEGWWQVLMQGVWVDGSRVLKNQPVVVDVREPPHQFCSFMILIPKPDQQPLHPRSPSRRQSLLRLHIRFPPSIPTILQLLRLPVPQSAQSSFRIRRREVPVHAWRPRRRLVGYSWGEIQLG